MQLTVISIMVILMMIVRTHLQLSCGLFFSFQINFVLVYTKAHLRDSVKCNGFLRQ
jgi:hypothetical protein